MPHALERVKEILFACTNNKTPLIVGASGGADSQALVHMLGSLGYTNVLLAHVDHGLRKNSHKDRSAVGVLAKRFGFGVEMLETSFSGKGNCASWAREKRYDFFEKLQRRQGAAYILTAHHSDDQLETMLFALGRGTTLHGLTQLRPQNGNRLRPLLGCSKEELMHYCRAHRIPFVQDSTNEDLAYTRNFLRHTLITPWKKHTPALLLHTRQFASYAAELQDFLRGAIEKKRWFKSLVAGSAVSQTLLQKESPVLLREAVALLHQYYHTTREGLTTARIEGILQFLHHSTSGKKRELTKGYSFQNQHGMVMLVSTAPRTALRRQRLTPETPIHWGPWRIKLMRCKKAPTPSQLKKGLYVAFAKPTTLFVRPWKDGDRFTPYGMKGRKKLSDYFTDQKIPLHERATIPVMVTGKDRIVALPKRPDPAYAVTKSSDYIYQLLITPL